MKGAALTRLGLALLLAAPFADAQRGSSVPPSASRPSSSGSFGARPSAAPVSTYRVTPSAPAPSAARSAPAQARPANTYATSPYAKLGAGTAAPKTSVTLRPQAAPPVNPAVRPGGPAVTLKKNAPQPASKTTWRKGDYDVYVPAPSAAYVTPTYLPNAAYAPAPAARRWSPRALTIILAALLVLTLLALAYRAGRSHPRR